MSAFESKKVEDCFDGSVVYEYLLSRGCDQAFITDLSAEVGILDYFPDFPRPFFRIRTVDGMQLKGVEGDRTFRVIFPSTDKKRRKEVFEQHLGSILSMKGGEC